MVLLAMYYLSHPAIIGVKYALPSEGSYLWVNKNLIEIAAMAVLLVFPASRAAGIDRFVASWLDSRQASAGGLPVREEKKKKMAA